MFTIDDEGRMLEMAGVEGRDRNFTFTDCGRLGRARLLCCLLSLTCCFCMDENLENQHLLKNSFKHPAVWSNTMISIYNYHLDI